MSKAICTNCHFLYDSRTGVDGVIAPGVSFWEIDDATFECPSCGSTKDAFIEIQEEIMVVNDADDLTDIEAEHVAGYFFEDDELVVVLAPFCDGGHPTDPEHHLEWVEVRDSAGEPIDRQYVHGETEFRFSVDEDEPFQVIVSCSIHGLWQAIPYENRDLHG
jgi:rubredoxin